MACVSDVRATVTTMYGLMYGGKNDMKAKQVGQYKKDLDKFYTSDRVVKIVLDELFAVLKNAGVDPAKCRFLEPCAGDGQFLSGLKGLGVTSVQSFDIEPERDEIIKSDFLKLGLPDIRDYITVGNPPFGYKGKLAASFINRCSEWGDIIAFVLPIQFRRFNIQKQVCDDLKLIFSSSNLDRDSFIFDGKKYHVNSLFQIWVNRINPAFSSLPDLRLLKPLPNRHMDFKTFTHNNTKESLKYFNKFEYKWDFAVVRQGYYDYEHRITDPNELIKNRQYLFVKYVNDISRLVFDHIDFMKLSRTNTSTPGFSNTDLVREYIEIKERIRP